MTLLYEPQTGTHPAVPQGRRRLGDLLLRAGVVTEQQLKEALDEQQTFGGMLGDTLVRQGALTEDVLVRALSKQLGLARADMDQEVRREALALLNVDLAVQYEVAPVALKNGRTLVVATSDPLNLSMLDLIRARTGCHIEPQVAAASAIRAAISRLYGVAMDPPDPSSMRVASSGQELTPAAAAPQAAGQMSGARPRLSPSVGVPAMAQSPTYTPAAGSGYAGMVTPPIGTAPPAAYAPNPYAGHTGAFAAVQAGQPSDLQRERESRALRGLIELLVEKGVISLDEYLARIR